MTRVNQNTAATAGKSLPKTGKELPDAPNGGGTAGKVIPPGEMLWICHGAMFQRPAGQPEKWDDLPIPEKVRWACVEEGLLKALAEDSSAAPAHGWRTMADCPSDGRPVWVFGGRYTEPTLRSADGSYWRSVTAAGLGRPTHWHPEMKPLAPADALDIAGAA